MKITKFQWHQDRHQFDEKGYIYLQNFFSTGVCEHMREMSDKMSAEAASILSAVRRHSTSLADRAQSRPDELIVVAEAENPSFVCRYEFILGSNPAFGDFLTREIQPWLEDLVQTKLVPFKDKTNEKAPGGGAFRPHQDFVAYQFFNISTFVTVLLSIDYATAENGCLQFASNFKEITSKYPHTVLRTIGQKQLLKYEEQGTRYGDIQDEISRHFDWEQLVCSPRDLVVFDAFVPHFSHANMSQKPRRAIFITFNRASEGNLYHSYYSEKRRDYNNPKFHVSTPTSRGER